MQRAKNSASVDDLIKVIRANNVGVDPHKGVGSLDAIAQHYQSFFEDCMHITGRLSKTQLTQAFCLVHPTVPRDEVDQFAGCLTHAFGRLRQKAKSCTSGSRTHNAVYELGQKLKAPKQTLGAKLLAHAKTAHKGASKGFQSSSSSSTLPVSSGHTLLPIQAKNPMAWSDDEDDWPAIPAKSDILEILSSQEKATETVQASEQQQPYLQFLDHKTCTLVRRFADKLVSADMKPGENGFALAWFGTEVVQTEMPNLMLEPAVQKKKKSYKRPAVAMEPAQECSSLEEEVSDEEVQPKKAKAESESSIACFTKQNYKFESLSFGTCKAEFYSAKSYIRFFDEKAKKWKLLVGTNGKNHHKELGFLVPFVKKANMDKAQIIALRNQSL